LWTFWSLTREWQSLGVLRVALGVSSLAAVAVLALLVNHLSGGLYFTKIAPVDPYAVGSSEDATTRLARSSSVFLREAFAPAESFDGVRVGFAPYFLLAVVLLAAIAAGEGAKVRLPARALGPCLRLLIGLGAFGYAPKLRHASPKSQRASSAIFFWWSSSQHGFRVSYPAVDTAEAIWLRQPLLVARRLYR
jgi:hypothetical protein